MAVLNTAMWSPPNKKAGSLRNRLSEHRDDGRYAGLSRLPLLSYSMPMVPTGQPSAASTIWSFSEKSAPFLTIIFSGTSNTSGQVASQAPHMVHSFSDSSKDRFRDELDDEERECEGGGVDGVCASVLDDDVVRRPDVVVGEPGGDGESESESVEPGAGDGDGDGDESDDDSLAASFLRRAHVV